MKHLICGIDGYIGWSLALHLARKGHTVYGIDNFSRRKNVQSVGSCSATPILEMEDRVVAAHKKLGTWITFKECDLLDNDTLSEIVRLANPDVIYHLGEQPSAPFSMVSRENAVYTQQNNEIGNLNLLFAMKENAPNAALVKLGTMGEYGTPNVDIPEGFFEIEFRGRKDKLPFPRQPGSFYHLSKVHDTNNLTFACKVWGLRATDIMQGVVYGTRIPEISDDSLLTRDDFEAFFGSAINRFCAQATIGHPITPYGAGTQRRGFIALVDSIQCLTIAGENPPEKGEYRVFNQLDDTYSIQELASIVQEVANGMGITVDVKNIENPRMEMEKHYYKVDHEALRNLGFKPTRSIREEVTIMLKDLARFKDRIASKESAIDPRVRWSNEPKTERTDTVPQVVREGR